MSTAMDELRRRAHLLPSRQIAINVLDSERACMTAMGEVVTKADAIAFAAAEVRIALEAVALSLEPILSDLCAHGMSSDLREWIDDIDQREHAAVDGVQEKLRALAREYHP